MALSRSVHRRSGDDVVARAGVDQPSAACVLPYRGGKARLPVGAAGRGGARQLRTVVRPCEIQPDVARPGDGDAALQRRPAEMTAERGLRATTVRNIAEAPALKATSGPILTSTWSTASAGTPPGWRCVGISRAGRSAPNRSATPRDRSGWHHQGSPNWRLAWVFPACGGACSRPPRRARGREHTRARVSSAGKPGRTGQQQRFTVGRQDARGEGEPVHR